MFTLPASRRIVRVAPATELFSVAFSWRSVDVDKLFDELKRVCDTLERGKLGLEESLALYAKGLELEKRLEAILNAANRRVVEIINPDGTIVPFDVEPKR